MPPMTSALYAKPIFGTYIIDFFSADPRGSTRRLIGLFITLAYLFSLRLVVSAYAHIFYTITDSTTFTIMQRSIGYILSLLLHAPAVTLRNAILALTIVLFALLFPILLFLVLVLKNHGIVQRRHRLLVMWSMCFVQICVAPYILDQLFFYQALATPWKYVYLAVQIIAIVLICVQEIFIDIFVRPTLQISSEFLPTYPLTDIAFSMSFILIHLLRSTVEQYHQFSAFLLVIIMIFHIVLAAASPTITGNTSLDIYVTFLITFVGVTAAIPVVLFCLNFSQNKVHLLISIIILIVLLTSIVMLFYVRLNVYIMRVFRKMDTISKIMIYFPYLYHNMLLRLHNTPAMAAKLASVKVIEKLLGTHRFIFSYLNLSYHYEPTEQIFAKLLNTLIDSDDIAFNNFAGNMGGNYGIDQQFRSNLNVASTFQSSSYLTPVMGSTGQLGELYIDRSTFTGNEHSSYQYLDNSAPRMQTFSEFDFYHTPNLFYQSFTFRGNTTYASKSVKDSRTGMGIKGFSSAGNTGSSSITGEFLLHHAFKNLYMHKLPRIYLSNYQTMTKSDVQYYLGCIKSLKLPNSYLSTAAAYIITALTSVGSISDLIVHLHSKGMNLPVIDSKRPMYQDTMNMVLVSKLQHHIVALLELAWFTKPTSNYNRIILCTYLIKTISYSEDPSQLSDVTSSLSDPFDNDLYVDSRDDNTGDIEEEGDATSSTGVSSSNDSGSSNNRNYNGRYNSKVRLDAPAATLSDDGPAWGDFMPQLFQSKIMQKLRDYIESVLFLNNVTDEATFGAQLNLPVLKRTDLDFSDDQLFLLYGFSNAMFSFVYTNSSYYRTFFAYHTPEVFKIKQSKQQEKTQSNLQSAALEQTNANTIAPAVKFGTFRKANLTLVPPSVPMTHSLRNPRSVMKMINIIYMRVMRGSRGTMSSIAIPWIKMCAFYKRCYEGLIANRDNLLNFGRSSLYRSAVQGQITDVLLLQVNYQLERIIFSLFFIHVFLFEVFKKSVFLIKDRPHFCRGGSRHVQYLNAYYRLFDCYQLLNTLGTAINTNYFSLVVIKLVKRRLEVQCRMKLIQLFDTISRNEIYNVLGAIEELESRSTHVKRAKPRHRGGGNSDSKQDSTSSSSSNTNTNANANASTDTGVGASLDPFQGATAGTSSLYSGDGIGSKESVDMYTSNEDYFSIHKAFLEAIQNIQQWSQMYEAILARLKSVYSGAELFIQSENMAYLMAQQFKLFTHLYKMSRLYYQFLHFLINNLDLQGVEDFLAFGKMYYYAYIDATIEGDTTQINQRLRPDRVYDKRKLANLKTVDTANEYGYCFLKTNMADHMKMLEAHDQSVHDNPTTDPTSLYKLTNEFYFRRAMRETPLRNPNLKVLYAELGALHNFINPSKEYTLCGRLLLKQAGVYYAQAIEHLFKIKMYSFMISVHLRLNKHKTNPVIASMFSTVSNIYTDFDAVKVLRFLKVELQSYQCSLNNCLRLYLTLFQEEPDNPTILVLIEALRYEFNLESLSFYLPLINFKASINLIKRRDFHNRTAVENLYTYLLSFYSTDNIFNLYGPLSKYNAANVTSEYLATLCHRIDYNSYLYNSLPYFWRKKHIIQHEQACALQVLGVGYFMSDQFAEKEHVPDLQMQNMHLSTLLLDYAMSDLNNRGVLEKNTPRHLFINSLHAKRAAQANKGRGKPNIKRDQALTPSLTMMTDVFRNTTARYSMQLIKRNGPDLDHYIGVLRNPAATLTSMCPRCRESLVGRCSIHRKIALLMLKGNGTYAQLFDIMKYRSRHRYPLSIHDFLFHNVQIASLNLYINMPRPKIQTKKNTNKSIFKSICSEEKSDHELAKMFDEVFGNPKGERPVDLHKSPKQLAYERAEVATRFFDDSLFQVVSISSIANKMQRGQLRFIRTCYDLTQKVKKVFTVKSRHEFNIYYAKIVSTFAGFRSSRFATSVICKIVLFVTNSVSENLKMGLYSIFQAVNEVSTKIYPCYFIVRFVKGPPALTPQLLPDAPGDVEDDALAETYTGRIKNNDVKPIGVFKGIDRETEFSLIHRMRQEFAEFGHFITVFAVSTTLLIACFFAWYIALVRQLSRYIPILKIMGDLLSLSYYRGLYASVSALPDMVLPVSTDDPVITVLSGAPINSPNFQYWAAYLPSSNNSVSMVYANKEFQLYKRNYLFSLIADQYNHYIKELTCTLLNVAPVEAGAGAGAVASTYYNNDSITSLQSTSTQNSTTFLHFTLEKATAAVSAGTKNLFLQFLLFTKLYLSRALSTITVVLALFLNLYIPVAHELEHIIDFSISACPKYTMTPEFTRVYSGAEKMNITTESYITGPILLYSCPALQYYPEEGQFYMSARPFMDNVYSMQNRFLGNTYIINIVDYSMLESYSIPTTREMEHRLDETKYFKSFMDASQPVFVSWSFIADIFGALGSGVMHAIKNMYSATMPDFTTYADKSTYSLLNTIADSSGKSIFTMFFNELNQYKTEYHINTVPNQGFYKDILRISENQFLEKPYQFMYYTDLLNQDTMPKSIFTPLSYEQTINDILLSFFPGISGFMFYQVPLASRDIDDYMALSLHSMSEQVISLNLLLITIPFCAQLSCVLFMVVYIIRLCYWLLYKENNLQHLLTNYLMRTIGTYGIGGLYDLDTNPLYKKHNVLAKHSTMLFTMKQLLNGNNINLASSNVDNAYARMQIPNDLLPDTEQDRGANQASSSPSNPSSQAHHTTFSLDDNMPIPDVNLRLNESLTGAISFKLGFSPEDLPACLQNEWRDFNEASQDIMSCTKCKTTFWRSQIFLRFLLGIAFFIFWISLAFLDDVRFINQRAYKNDTLRTNSYFYDFADLYSLLLRRTSKAMSYSFFGAPSLIGDWADLANQVTLKFDTFMSIYPESSSILFKLMDQNDAIFKDELQAMGYTLAFICPDGSFYADIIRRSDEEHYFDQHFGGLFSIYGQEYIEATLNIKFTNTDPKTQQHKLPVSDYITNYLKTHNKTSLFSFELNYMSCDEFFDSMTPPNNYTYSVIAEAIKLRLELAENFCKKELDKNSVLEVKYTKCEEKYDKIDENNIFEHLLAMQFFLPTFDRYSAINQLSQERATQITVIKADRMLTVTVLSVILTATMVLDLLVTILLLRRVFFKINIVRILIWVFNSLRWGLELIVLIFLLIDINVLKNVIYTWAEPNLAMLMDSMEMYRNLLSNINSVMFSAVDISNHPNIIKKYLDENARLLDLNLTIPVFIAEKLKVTPNDELYTAIFSREGFYTTVNALNDTNNVTAEEQDYKNMLTSLLSNNNTIGLDLYYAIYGYCNHILNGLLESPIADDLLPSSQKNIFAALSEADARLNTLMLGIYSKEIETRPMALLYAYTSLANVFDTYSSVYKKVVMNSGVRVKTEDKRTGMFTIKAQGAGAQIITASLTQLMQLITPTVGLIPPYVRIISYIAAIFTLLMMAFIMQRGSIIYYDRLQMPDFAIKDKKYVKAAFIVILSKAEHGYTVVSVTEIPDSDLYLHIRLTSLMRGIIRGEIQRRVSADPELFITKRLDFTAVLVYPNNSNITATAEYSRSGFEFKLRTDSEKVLHTYLEENCNEIKVYPAFIHLRFPKHLCSSCIDEIITEIVHLNDKRTSCAYHEMKDITSSANYLAELPEVLKFVPIGLLYTDTKLLLSCKHDLPLYKCKRCMKGKLRELLDEESAANLLLQESLVAIHSANNLDESKNDNVAASLAAAANATAGDTDTAYAMDDCPDQSVERTEFDDHSSIFIDIRAIFEPNKPNKLNKLRNFGNFSSFNRPKNSFYSALKVRVQNQLKKIQHALNSTSSFLEYTRAVFRRTPFLFQYSPLTVIVYTLIFVLVIVTLILIVHYSLSRILIAQLELQLYSLVAQLLYYSNKVIETSFKHISVISQGHYADITKDILQQNIGLFLSFVGVLSRSLEKSKHDGDIHKELIDSIPLMMQFVDSSSELGVHSVPSALFYQNYIKWLDSMGKTVSKLQEFSYLTGYKTELISGFTMISLWIVVVDVVVLLILRQVLLWLLNKELVKVGYIAKLLHK